MWSDKFFLRPNIFPHVSHLCVFSFLGSLLLVPQVCVSSSVCVLNNFIQAVQWYCTPATRVVITLLTVENVLWTYHISAKCEMLLRSWCWEVSKFVTNSTAPYLAQCRILKSSPAPQNTPLRKTPTTLLLSLQVYTCSTGFLLCGYMSGTVYLNIVWSEFHYLELIALIVITRNPVQNPRIQFVIRPQ